MVKIAAVFLFFGFFLVGASGQTTTGTIVGRVEDDGERTPLEGAQITATNLGTNLKRDPVRTNDSGNYSIPDLPVGRYRIEAELEGFKRYVLTGISVVADRRVSADIRLPPGSPSQSIVVHAVPPLLHADDSAVGGYIDGPTILQLPLNGRLYETLAQLFPGVYLPVPGGHLGARGGMNAMGIDEHYNLFLLDGIDNGDPVIRNWAFRPPIDQIYEFKLVQAGAPAEFGRSAGMVVSASTRSGTNEFHGSIWEFLRNDKIAARNYFAPAILPKPSFIRNQFGVTLGGPIRRNRTFFFAAYEGLRSKQGLSRLATVPTDRMRAGDLTEINYPSVDPSEFHPLAVELMQAFPLPNLDGTRGNRIETANRIEDGNDYSVKVDHRLFNNTWVFGRVSSSVTRLLDPFRNETGGGVNLAGFGQTADRIRTSGGFSAITTIGKIVNEFRAGYTRVRQPVTPLTGETPGQIPLLGFEKTFLNFNISDFDPLGSGNEFKRAVNVYNYIDTISVIAGNHQIKAGVDVRRYLFNSYAVSPNSFTFDGRRTGSPMGDFLRGLPSFFLSFEGSPGGNARKTEVAWFVQDDWKASPRLTISYGVRWEYYGRILEKNNKQSLWVPECNCMRTAGDGIPEQLVDNDFNNFAPRVGLAYRPFSDGKTVVRLFGGIFYDNDMRHNTEVISNPPFFRTDVYAAAQMPALSFDNPFPTVAGAPTLAPVTLDRRYRDTYAGSWTLGIQRELPARTVVELTYIGNHVVKARRLRNLNQPINGVMPFSEFAAIYAFEQAGSSNSNSLQTRIEKRFNGGFGFISSFTWAHAIDDRPSQGGGFVQDNTNFRADRADADFDVRHRWSISSVWDVPLGAGRRWGANMRGLPQAVLGGWGVSLIGIVQSGRPLTVTLDSNNSGTGNRVDRPAGVDGVHWKPADQGPDQWFNPAAFTIPTAGTFGNFGRNALRGPGYQNVDISLSKTQAIGDAARLQFRVELFNALNHANFAPPATQLPTQLNGKTTTFGVISSTVTPQRQIQFGIRLDY